MIFLKFHITLVEGFIDDLKTFSSLAMPNQYCLGIKVRIKLVLGDILGQDIPNLRNPYIKYY